MAASIPTPTVTYEFSWLLADGPPCRTVGDELDARATSVHISVLADDNLHITVKGAVVTKTGARDRRYSYDHLCWTASLGDDVLRELGDICRGIRQWPTLTTKETPQ